MRLGIMMRSDDFQILVQKEFSFLVSDYQFLCVKSDDSLVRYESESVFAAVRYDVARSYEIDVEVGELDVLYDGKERPFSLSEILRLEGVAENERYVCLQASTLSALSGCISKLSSLLSVYGVEFLKNNKFAFKRLSDFREKECDQYEMRSRLEYIRREVDVAWKNKNYAKVVELYRPVETDISDAERRKLAFAEKQVK